MDLTRQEIEKVKEKMKSLIKLAKTDRFYIEGLTEREILEKTNIYLEKHCKIGEADIDVVATAIYESKQGYHPGVIERDKDIKQAIEMLNKTPIIKKKKIGKNIVDYIDIYKN